MQVNMLDAKSKLSSLVAAVERGEEVILARGGVPVAKIVKYEKPKVKPPGAWKGLVRISSDWNSAETNAMVEDLFYGETQPEGGSRSRKAGKRAAGKPAKKR
ncbi:MAG: type II toxin-antitoxin system Phd/YefM family antitoxin [Pyrinomonadaceae bacterium]